MASKKSQKYWEEREAEALKHYITEEEEFKKEIDKIYRDMLDSVQNEIYSFYGHYATKEGISMAEAKKRVSQADIKALERKAKQYVKDAAKDRRANFGKTNTEGYYFSDEANEEMRLYNLTMKVNRLEMLKANIGLELIDGHSKLEKFMGDILQGRTEAELKRQAGILGKTIQNNAQAARVIVNASFHNATFSERIWMYNDAMKADLSRMISTALIQGKNPRVFAKELEKYYIGEEKLKNGKKGAKYRAESLLITELARVQTEAQKESYIRNGFEEYTFHANSGCCDICDALNGKHFKVKDMMPGKNAPPMHTRCRCSTSAYEDSADYEAWLDYLDKGGTTEEWNEIKSSSNMDDNDSRNRRKQRQQDVAKLTSEYNELVQKYSTRESKWSGNVVFDDKKCKEEGIAGRKLWSCDILLKTGCQEKTIIHELLHACSGSYLNPLSYIRYGRMEEASVELLAREICENENIVFRPNANPRVEYLYEINEITKICDENLDFATALFAKSLKNRYNWLEGRVKKYIQGQESISKKQRERLEFLLSELKGHK